MKHITKIAHIDVTKALDPDKGIDAVMWAGGYDRVGDAIAPGAIRLENFNKNPIMLYQHDHNAPIGTWSNVRQIGDQLLGTFKLAAAGTSSEIDAIREMVKQGILRAISIGFNAFKYQEDEQYDRHTFTDIELLEASLVSVPCSPGALVIARSFGADEKRIFRNGSGEVSPSTVNDLTRRKADAAHNTTFKHIGHQAMNLQDQIKQAQADSVTTRDELVNLQSRMASGEDVSKALDTAMDAVEKADAEVERLTRLEKLTAGTTAKAVGTPMINRQTYQEKAVAPGTHLARLALVKASAYRDRSSEEAVAEKMFPGEKATMAIVKAATRVADTTTSGWAQELVRQELRGMIMGDLAPISIAATLAGQGTYLNFNGARKITMPSMSNNTTNLAGAFVGENGVIPVKEGVVSSLSIEAFKMGVITTITKELERASDPDSVELLRRMLMQDTANALDTAVIGNTAAVSGVRPKGLLNGVTIGTGASGGGVAAVTADIKTLLGAFITANVGAKPVLIMNTATKLSLSVMTSALGEFTFAEEVANGMLRGVPIIASNRVPSNRVILVDAAYFAGAFDSPEIDVSEQATLSMANASGVAPTQAENGSGAIGTAEQVPADGGGKILGAGAGAAFVGLTGISLFQQYALAIRLVMPVGWGMTYAGTVAALDSVTW
jgi:HK97 family phage prohead protease